MIEMVRDLKQAARHYVTQLLVANLIATAYLLIIVSGPILGRLEGWFYPVVSSVKINEMNFENGETTFKGTAVKERDCKFVRMEWFVLNDDEAQDARLSLREAIKYRDQGAFEFGPWSVRLSPSQLIGHSYGIVEHKMPLYVQHMVKVSALINHISYSPDHSGDLSLTV